MTPARFHLPQFDAGELAGDEAKHATQVLRHQAGDRIIVFDGEGTEADAEIAAISGKRVALKILDRRFTPPPPVSLTLFQAIPKGANMELIIEKAVELGVNAIFPVLTERTVVRLDGAAAAKKQEKWQHLAVEACKQCGQNWLPKIHTPGTFAGVLAQLPPHDVKIIAAIQPDAKSLKAILAERPTGLEAPSTLGAVLAIGPEGDFTPGEYAAAREAGFAPMTLGPLVLRVETATLYALSVLSHELRGDAHARPRFEFAKTPTK